MNAPAPPLDPATILVVDDVPENLALLFDVLSGAEFTVLVAENGDEALERMPELQPDLVLLDIVMPGSDGFAVCRQLKEDAAFADVPIIFMTARNETVDKVKGFRAGAVDYVGKPFEPEEVLARVRAHLQLRQLRRELEQQNGRLIAEVERRRAAERQLEDSLDQAVIVAGPDSDLQFCTQHAWELLGRYFDACATNNLPPAIAAWCHTDDAHHAPLVFERPDGQLHVRLYAEREPGATVILRLDEKLNIAGPDLLRQLGLTPREAEVLYWGTQGKTTPEIGIILGAASNTVKEHLVNIFAKLGVETRTAAALRAMEILGTTRDAT